MKGKGVLIFLVGFITGGGVGFFASKTYLKKKLEKEKDEKYSKMEEENVELKDYLKRIRMLENMKDVTVSNGYISQENAGSVSSKDSDLARESMETRAGKVDYTRFYSANEEAMEAMAESEHPREEYDDGYFDDPEESYYRAKGKHEDAEMEAFSRDMNNTKKKPKLIKESDWLENSRFDKVDLLYYMNDEIVTTEDGEIVHDADEILGDCLDKYDFKTNDEKVIYVRNMRRGCDYEVAKIFGSYSDEY